MIKIVGGKDLNTFLIKSELKDQISSLSISLCKDTIIPKQIQKLQSLTPTLEDLTIKVSDVTLQNQFIISLEQAIKQWKNLKKISLDLNVDGLSQKKVKQFIYFIKNIFFTDDIIEYSCLQKQTYLNCGSCRIRFQFNMSQSLWIKDMKDKTLKVFLPNNSIDFIELIYSNIEREIDNLDIILFHQKEQYGNFSNGSNSYQLQIKLIFESLRDLLLYSVQNHCVSFLKVPSESLKCLSEEENNQVQKFNNGFNFNLKNGFGDYFLKLNIKNPLINKQFNLLEKYLIDLNGRISINLKCQTKFNIFNNTILPTLISRYYQQSFQIILLADKIGVKIKSKSKHYQNNKQFIHTSVIQCENNHMMLEIMKNYFKLYEKSQSSKVFLVFKITRNEIEQQNFDINEFYLGAANMDTRNLVHSLRISDSNINYQYPLLRTMKNLKILTIFTIVSEQLYNFINNNIDYLKGQNQDLQTIKLYYQQENNYGFSRQIQNKLKNIIFQFKRAVSFSFSSKYYYFDYWQECHFDKKIDDYHDDYYYYYYDSGYYLPFCDDCGHFDCCCRNYLTFY